MSLSINTNTANVALRELTPTDVRHVAPLRPELSNAPAPVAEPALRQPLSVETPEPSGIVKTSSINPLNITVRADEPTATEADRTIRQPVVIDRDSNLYTQNTPAARPEPPPQPSASTTIMKGLLTA